MKIINTRRTVLLALAALLALAMPACAQTAVSTSMVMRVSHMTQNAVVDAGEDLSMDVSVNGITPSSYQWFYEGEAITGENQKVFNLEDARPEDSGIYRLEAYDANGAMLVSMETSVRVIDGVVPKSGDTSLPPQAVVAMMGAAGAVLIGTLAKRRHA